MTQQRYTVNYKIFCFLTAIVTKLYPHDPAAVHSKLQDIFDNLEDMKEDERSYLLIIINEIAQVHPEVSYA